MCVCVSNIQPRSSFPYRCDQCNGDADAVRFPVSVEVSNFTDYDQAAYVILYVAQQYNGKWWQPGYPAILSAITSMNETIDVCTVPQQFTTAPSLIPLSRNPTHAPTHAPKAESIGSGNRRHMLSSTYDSFEEEEAGRRLHSPGGAAGRLDDDFATDDLSAAQLGCCIGSPGQLYMVACVVRDWPGTGNVGKTVKGPPFDDRCVTVSGACGVTCGARLQEPKSHCEEGVIPQRYLVADYCGNKEDDNDGSGNCGPDTKRVDDDYYQEQKSNKKKI